MSGKHLRRYLDEFTFRLNEGRTAIGYVGQARKSRQIKSVLRANKWANKFRIR